MEIKDLYNYFKKSKGVSTDTRQVKPGNLYFALKGPNFNGNAYAHEAIAKGASYAVIDEEAHFSSDRCLLVPNALEALQQLATFHRNQFSFPFLAITGSNGKTTTKELLKGVLAQSFRVHATQGNLNNHIGVPLTLLNMPLNTNFAAIEMGDNHLGDVTHLCEIARPTHGFITNIGKDHLEGFGGFEENVRAKSELFHYLLQQQGTAFIYAGDPILHNMAKRFKAPILYGQPDTFSYAVLLDANPFVRYQTEEKQVVTTKMVGAYNFQNILTAIAVGKYFAVPDTAVHQAIAAYQPDNNRSQVVEAKRNTLLLDAYNANPSSVEAALASFAMWDTDKPKWVILGDMFELGQTSAEEHGNIIKLAETFPFARVICCGDRFFAEKKVGQRALFFAKKAELLAYLESQKPEACLVMLKGSRGMALETLQDCF